MRLKTNTNLAVIFACFVLHNISLDDEPDAYNNVHIPQNAYDAVRTNPRRQREQTAARIALICFYLKYKSIFKISNEIKQFSY